MGSAGLGPDSQLHSQGTRRTSGSRCYRARPSEIALYTFKYVDDVDSVIVFMPTSTKGQSNGSVFLRRADLAELRRPIARLLPSHAPRVGGLGKAELSNILRLTRPRIYAFQFQAASNGRPILVLTPPAAGA